MDKHQKSERMPSYKNNVLVIIILLATAYAEPTCRNQGMHELVCYPGDDDFVLGKGLVSGNSQTTKITLKGCRITDIEPDAFINDGSLRTVDLSDNKITKLKLGVLDQIQQVTHLDLSRNLLTALSAGIFNQNTNLELLNLKGNKLNKLDRGVFDPLIILRHLDLSSNALLGRDMDPQLLMKCREIRYLDFSGNDMSSAPHTLVEALVNIESLNLEGCSLTEVPLFAKGSKAMKNLMLTSNQIKNIDAASFANFENLETLNLAYNLIEQLAADVFTPLKSLKVLTLKSNRLRSLPANIFINMKVLGDEGNLRNLDLSGNKISHLNSSMMEEMKEVTHLDLAYNILTTLPVGTFEHNSNLELLDLKGNRLNFLEPGLFDPLRRLGHLDLSSNSLLGRDLDPQLLKNCREIRFMDFSSNDMTGTPENLLDPLIYIDFLNLYGSSLREVPSFATRSSSVTMKRLMLTANKISKIENPTVFDNLEDLEILYLADNVIRSLGEDIFKPLNNLKMVDLKNNKLRNLPDKLFFNVKSVEDIDLSNNLIEYIPVNTFKGTALRNLNLSRNRFSYLEANFILELKNSRVPLRKFLFDDNPWQCACLNEILSEVKNYGIEYNNAKYDGGSSVCVTTTTFVCKRQLSDNDLFIELYDKKNI